VFLYNAGEEFICFDAGFIEGSVRKKIIELGVNPKAIQHVFLTHTDSDHRRGLRLFNNANVYFSADEEQMVNKTRPRFSWFWFNQPITQAHTLLKDGDIVHAGEASIQAISTPGHTPGSMSYLVNDSALIVGDALRLTKGKVRPFSGLRLASRLSIDVTTQQESIKKLAKLKDISVMATGHTGFTTDFAHAMSEWL
jgi:hydroxyacylglutathione hydrolase